MRAVLVDTLLAVAVLGVWLAVGAALRCRDALDRLHATAFVVTAPLVLIVVAAAIQEGLSSRLLNILFLLVVLLVGGAAVTYVSARAIDSRSARREP